MLLQLLLRLLLRLFVVPSPPNKCYLVMVTVVIDVTAVIIMMQPAETGNLVQYKSHLLNQAAN